jgi:transcriptional regulator with XRE-family HTH domain
MELSKYIKMTGITATELAAMVGITPSAMSNYRQGIRFPRREIALRIVAATKGQVSLSDLYSSTTDHDLAA